MSEFQEDVLSITWHKIKSTRTHVLCVCRLPEEVRDRLAREVVRKAHGAFILSFSSFPSVGEEFPYQGQMWRVKSIVQFPRRYKTQEPSYPAIARLEWLASYESVESVLMEYLDLEAE